MNEEIGLWFPGSRPPVTPVDALAALVTCDEDLRARKHAALRAYAGQTDRLVEVVGEEHFAQWWDEEAFVAGHDDDG